MASTVEAKTSETIIKPDHGVAAQKTNFTQFLTKKQSNLNENIPIFKRPYSKKNYQYQFNCLK